MFSVLFEVHPRTEEWDTYLDYGKMLRPELEDIHGFVDNIRYRSLARVGWLLSLSGWRDEKALVRWRTSAAHHGSRRKAATTSSSTTTSEWPVDPRQPVARRVRAEIGRAHV